MNGKEKYEDISIPEELEQTVEQAKRRGERARRRRTITSIGSAVACCLIVFLLANIPPVYAALYDVPVLGTVVRVLKVGGGGRPADGLNAGAKAEENKIKLTFTKEGQSPAGAPAYRVEKRTAPERLFIELYGVRAFDYDAIMAEFKKLSCVKDIYRNMLLDDSAYSFVVELKGKTDYEVSEYQEPGYLELSFTTGTEPLAEKEVYFLRTEAMEQSERLAALRDENSKLGCTTVKTSGGQFCNVIGAYDTEAEAEAQLATLNKEYGGTAPFFVDHCKNTENPK